MISNEYDLFTIKINCAFLSMIVGEKLGTNSLFSLLLSCHLIVTVLVDSGFLLLYNLYYTF